MQKTLYLIGGAMGVGKTTVCQLLKKQLPKSVFLDGDWCWDADPFQVTEETKAMVMDNICFVLNRFLHCSAYENILFCWVMDRQSILDALLERLDRQGCRTLCLSLTASPEALSQRLSADIACGKREPDILERSLGRLPLYEVLNTCKIDTTGLTVPETADEIRRLSKDLLLE